jgi:hypothetical protein
MRSKVNRAERDDSVKAIKAAGGNINKQVRSVEMPILRGHFNGTSGVPMGPDADFVVIPIHEIIGAHFGGPLYPGMSVNVSSSSFIIGIELDECSGLDIAIFARDAPGPVARKGVPVKAWRFDVGQAQGARYRLLAREEYGLGGHSLNDAAIFGVSLEDIPHIRLCTGVPEWKEYDRLAGNIGTPTKGEDHAIRLDKGVRKGWRQLNVLTNPQTKMLRVSAALTQTFDIKKTGDGTRAVQCTPPIEMVLVLKHREGRFASENMISSLEMVEELNGGVLKSLEVLIRYKA